MWLLVSNPHQVVRYGGLHFDKLRILYCDDRQGRSCVELGSEFLFLIKLLFEVIHQNNNCQRYIIIEHYFYHYSFQSGETINIQPRSTVTEFLF